MLPQIVAQALDTTLLCFRLCSLKAENRCQGRVRPIIRIHNFVLINARRLQNVEGLPQLAILLLPGSLRGTLGPECVAEWGAGGRGDLI